MKTIKLLSAALLVVAAAPALAAGAGNKLLSTHADWEAYAAGEKTQRVCYAASVPKKNDGNRETYVSVSHRPGEKAHDVVNVAAGYKFKEQSEVELEIGTQKFKLFTAGDGAWAKDAATDKAIVDAMRRGNALVVRGTPAKGKPTEDSYSLSGFSAAYAAIGKACEVK